MRNRLQLIKAQSEREKIMSNFKDNPRYNVISLRVTDQEKAAIAEVSRRTRKSVSQIMLEAIQSYSRDVDPLSATNGSHA